MTQNELVDITDELFEEDYKDYKKHNLRLFDTPFDYLFEKGHILDEDKHINDHFMLQGDFMYRSPRLWTYDIQNPEDGKIHAIESDCFGQIIDNTNRSLVAYIAPELLGEYPELAYKGYVQKDDKTLVSPIVIRDPTFMVISEEMGALAPLCLLRYKEILTPKNVSIFSSFSQTDRENLEVSLTREMIKNSPHII